MNYKIGNLRLKNNLVLAPMAGINDTAFRMLCKRYGAGLVYTEMINANAIFNKNKATLKKLNFVEEERPIAVQLFGANLKMLESAAVIAEEKADIIDINFKSLLIKLDIEKKVCEFQNIKIIDNSNDIKIKLLSAFPIFNSEHLLSNIVIYLNI